MLGKILLSLIKKKKRLLPAIPVKNYLRSQLIARWKLLWASPLFGTASPAGRSAYGKTTLITMIRNEKSILETFCAHALSLFDRVILVDHLSTDGSREYIKVLAAACPNIESYFFDEPGYYQSELMTWIARNLVDHKEPGWVFFLDADEFLPFGSREEFGRKLSEFASFPVISMPWLNLVPLDMENGAVMNQSFLKPPRPSRHHKIAFQPSRIAPADYFIAQGNHALFLGTRTSKVRFPAKAGFPLYHLPIRTKQQLRDKILHGVESYRSMGSDRRGKNGAHWDEIHRIMQATSLTNELMAGIAAQYNEVLAPPYERSLDELRAGGYTEFRMEIGFSQGMVSFADAAPAKQTAGGMAGPGVNRSIAFDRSTRSMRLAESAAPPSDSPYPP